MIIESNKLVVDHILVRYGELSTKGKNKNEFIKRLLQNIKNSLKGFEDLTFEKSYDRIYIMLNGTNPDDISPILKNVFGISSFSYAIKIPSELEDMIQVGCQLAIESKAKTFKIETKRHHKPFPYISDEINRAVASEILKNSDMKVDVHHPEFLLRIEVRQFDTYIMPNKIKGAGGYPVGIGGKALVMLSGGIDSPVASYLMMKRGITVECIHYASPPYTSTQAKEKVLELARIVSQYQGHIRVHIVPFTDIQLAIYQNCDESYAITIMRRMMYRLAQMLCEKTNCKAIVNGESIGQVASQTLDSMRCINEVVSLPVIRPCVTMDKLEIIDLANKIETYETSILPYEDCCTIFTPKNPVTRPTSKKCEKLESRFDYQTYLEEALNQIEVLDIYPNKQDTEDIF
ncbi:MAG: tRNA uracil 4-sulfurtransferase ThiI [Traorella sp.]